MNNVVTNGRYVVTNNNARLHFHPIKEVSLHCCYVMPKHTLPCPCCGAAGHAAAQPIPQQNTALMKNSHIALYADLLFCLVIMPLTITLLPVDRWIVNNTAFLIALVAYVYALYFVYRRACIPKLFMQKKYMHIALLVPALAAATLLLTRSPLPAGHTGTQRQTDARLHMRTQTIWFFFLMVTGFSLAIELTFELFRQILMKQEIAAEKDKAELGLYKAQINPHFLFNTLNTLYAPVLTGSGKAEQAFVKFSDILHYMYQQARTETIPIEKEIEYIRQYTCLQELRLNRHTKVELTAEADNGLQPVPPMILITLIENAFKYGTSAETDCRIGISIRLKDGCLAFSTTNRIMRKGDPGRRGIGIANCRRRLEMLYPGRFELETRPEGDTYITKLKIMLQ